MTTSIASLQIQPLHASFGVEIGGVDLRQPLDPARGRRSGTPSTTARSSSFTIKPSVTRSRCG